MELTLDQALQQGIGAHKAGEFQDAERLYTAILKALPKHPDANHNMGVLAVGAGKVQEALPFFQTALVVKPSIEQFWLSYMDALIKLGQINEAKSVFDQAKDKGATGEAFEQLEHQLTDLLLGPSRSNVIETEDLDTPKSNFKKLPQRKKAINKLQLLAEGQALVPQDPPSEELQPIINLYTQGQLQQALSEIAQVLERYPNSATLYNIVGASKAGLLQFDAAIHSYSEALKIQPNFFEAYNNMGTALKNKGALKAAIESYKNALKIKPDFVAAYINMGNLLLDKDDLEEAIKNYKKAIKINPDCAEAYHYMGIALRDKGELDAALKSHTQALKIKPDYAEAQFKIGVVQQQYTGDLEAAINSYDEVLKIEPDTAQAKKNLVSLLTSYTPQKESINPIIKVNEAIRKIDITCKSSKTIPDEHIVNLFLESSSFIIGNSLEIRTELTQTYRRNSVDLNCKRHMSIFNEHDIIPEFCFGCYKVQVEPRSIIDLIKLYVVFDQLELDDNNTRKCMVELRPDIPGFYKGLIYCSGLKEAGQIAEYLNRVVKDRIGSGMSAKVKRGCSEYPVSFPDYKEINHSGPQLMRYPEDWKVIENDHDRKKPMKAKENLKPSLSGLSLNDVLIIRKWLDYARGIGDSSADSINYDVVKYPEVYNLAKARLGSYHFTN